MGVSGYWFGQSYDGVSCRLEMAMILMVRIGVGTFKHGYEYATDSAYPLTRCIKLSSDRQQQLRLIGIQS
ncbi:MAG: hypothetical protein ACLUPK_06635 [Veillonella sp.]